MKKAMTLDEVCEYWGVEQGEVDFRGSGFEKSWWQNCRTLERIRIAEETVKIVIHKIELLGERQIEIVMEGSGDPAEDHDIIGVKIYDRDGNFLTGMGRTDDEPDLIEDRGKV